MTLLIKVFDTETKKTTSVPYPGYSYGLKETVSVSDKTEFTSSIPFDDIHVIDVYVDGREQEEDIDYTRNSANNKIIFGVAVEVGKRVKIKIYLK